MSPEPISTDTKANLQFTQYQRVVQKTEAWVQERNSQKEAADRGLNILNVTWEDTARFKGSAVGLNISDMTIQVQQKHPESGAYDLTCMPVIRHPNFHDRTADVSLDDFSLLVGNETGNPLRKVTLRDFLGNLREYLTDGRSWPGGEKSLLADRDAHVLVSPQACFLPIPREGEAQFNVALFNYQSRAGAPAVLTILATREGTSVTVIDNQRDGFGDGRSWGQRLFFNQHGERASLTGKHMSDFTAERACDNESDTSRESVEAGDESGLNLVLVIQVPLKHEDKGMDLGTSLCLDDTAMIYCAAGASDVEEAVIGHGPVEGPFTEIDGIEIERDPDYPIRVTVQFYQATSNGVVSGEDLDRLAGQFERVYVDADYVGSLVTEGATDRRPRTFPRAGQVHSRQRECHLP
jgi:hypothetical protein